ncbi:tetratricopeptide repeat protein [candidate division KSB1 bacterium]|nr:tetratricopeptide repeat protein [candidate division KSB1 bacterium]
MKLSVRFATGFVLTLTFLLFSTATILSQDLNQQKQAKLKQVTEIDAKLKGSPSPEEYEDLIKKREKIAAEIEAINKQLMSDDDAMKKINAAKRACNDGNNALKLGQFPEALNHYNKAISLDASFAQAHYGKGLTLKKQRKYKEALAALQAAIDNDAAYSRAYLSLGKTYNQLSQPDQAIAVYNKAIQYDPKSPKMHYMLGEVYQTKKKDYKKASENFRKATQLDPAYDKAFYSLGVSLIELGKLDQAVMALENALAVTKKKRWEGPHYRLAVAYNKKSAYSKAKAAAIEALNNKKNYAPAAYEAGKACKELGQFNEAINYFGIAGKSRVWKKTADYEIDLIKNRDKYGSN